MMIKFSQEPKFDTNDKLMIGINKYSFNVSIILGKKTLWFDYEIVIEVTGYFLTPNTKWQVMECSFSGWRK